MNRLFGSLVRTGLRRGRQGSRIWMTVGASSWVLQRVVTAIRKDEEQIESFRLKPGETVEISAHTPPTKKERKAAKRSARRAS